MLSMLVTLSKLQDFPESESHRGLYLADPVKVRSKELSLKRITPKKNSPGAHSLLRILGPPMRREV